MTDKKGDIVSVMIKILFSRQTFSEELDIIWREWPQLVFD